MIDVRGYKVKYNFDRNLKRYTLSKKVQQKTLEKPPENLNQLKLVRLSGF